MTAFRDGDAEPGLLLAKATLAAAKREYREKELVTLKPRTIRAAATNGVLTQSAVTPLTRLLAEPAAPRTFAACAYVPPRPASDDGPKMAGAALFERLSLDEVRATLAFCSAGAMGATVLAHRAFALPVEETARSCSAVASRRPNAASSAPRSASRPGARSRRGATTPPAPAAPRAGGAHSLILRARAVSRGDDDDGDGGDTGGVVSACGRGTCGQLGLGAAAYDVSVPRPIVALRDVVSVSAGGHHSLAVTADGGLWAWGKASDHQLGLGNLELTVLGHGGTRPSPTPKRVLPLRARKCVDAAAGGFHSFVVVDDGSLYAFGLGADGRLGLGHCLNASLPEKVPLDAFCRAAAAGAAHGAAVDDAGALYTWGDGSKGALGHRGPKPKSTKAGKKEGGLSSMPSWESARALGEVLAHSSGAAPDSEHAPRRVAALADVRVVAVCASERETACLDADGVVYVARRRARCRASPRDVAQGPELLAGIGRPRSGSGAASPTATAGIGRASSPTSARRARPPAPKSAVVTHTFHAPVAELATSALHTLVATFDDTYFDGSGASASRWRSKGRQAGDAGVVHRGMRVRPS
ncbi:ubiquitin-protein transferase [Aureococcus anophagefferens]|nr:ubiquitin-protein transferase [Aureococcus anophagefferens]